MIAQHIRPVRRRVLLTQVGSLAMSVGCGLLLAACGGSATASVTPSSAPTTAASQPTASTVTQAATSTGASSIASTGSFANSASSAGSQAVTSARASTTTSPVLEASSQAVNKDAITVQYGTDYSDNPDQLKSYQSLLIDAFTKDHPNIKLEFIQGDAYTDKFKTALASGTPWDVVWEADSSIYVQGFIQNISSYVAKDKFNTGVYPTALFQQINVWKSAINGLPNQAGGNWPVVPFNRVLLRKTGLDDPPETWGDDKWTWDTLREYAKKTTTTSNGTLATAGLLPLGDGALIWNLPWLWGGQWISDDRTKVVCDSAETIACYNAYYALPVQDGSMPKPTEIKNDFGITNGLTIFAQGKAEFVQTSGGGLSNVLDAVKKNADMGYAPIPKVKNFGSFQWLDSNGLVSGSKHPDEAWTYLLWQANSPNFALARGTVPPRSDFLATWAQQAYGSYGAGMRIQVYEKSLGNVAKIDPGWILPSFSDAMEKLQDKWRDDVYVGKQTVEGGLRALAPQLQALLDREDAKYKG